MRLTDGVGVRPEHFVDVSDGLLESRLLLAVFLQLLEVRNQIIRIHLVFNHVNLIAHSRLESLLESLKINESLLLSIQHIMHQSDNLLFASKNLVFLKMVLKVLVRDETVTIDVHLSEDAKEPRLTVKDFVFDLNKEVTHALGSVIVDILD